MSQHSQLQLGIVSSQYHPPYSAEWRDRAEAEVGDQVTEKLITDAKRVDEPEKGTKACLMLTEKAGPCSSLPAAQEGTEERLVFL